MCVCDMRCMHMQMRKTMGKQDVAQYGARFAQTAKGISEFVNEPWPSETLVRYLIAVITARYDYETSLPCRRRRVRHVCACSMRVWMDLTC